MMVMMMMMMMMMMLMMILMIMLMMMLMMMMMMIMMMMMVMMMIMLMMMILTTGEFMQLSAKEDKEERFKHYMKKTYKKTASLLSNSCKSVAVLSGCNEQVSVQAGSERLGMSCDQ